LGWSRLQTDPLGLSNCTTTHTRHRDGEQFRDTLTSCIAAVDAGAAVFPISDSIYMEIAKIGQYRQRRDLRDVIELVSRYRVPTARARSTTSLSRPQVRRATSRRGR
jgi:hypothetical protein